MLQDQSMDEPIKDQNPRENDVENPSESQPEINGNDTESGRDGSTAEKEMNEQKEKYLRLYAEFENFKKRNAREKLEYMKLAGQEIIRDLLPVLDDFQRAEKVYSQDKNAETYVSGVKLIFEKLQRTLQNKGLKQVESIGKEFNIEYHEAIAEVPAPSEDGKGKIIDEAESGYTLNDSVIRYAKVIVGK
jgi:molecular chaperone GrpE